MRSAIDGSAGRNADVSAFRYRIGGGASGLDIDFACIGCRVVCRSSTGNRLFAGVQGGIGRFPMNDLPAAIDDGRTGGTSTEYVLVPA